MTNYNPVVASTVVGIQGPMGSGAPGTKEYSGAGAPSTGLGVNGDHYINNSTGDYYEKQTGAWVILLNLKGPVSVTSVTTIPVSGASQALTFATTGNKAYIITASQALALTVSAGTSGHQFIYLWLFNPNNYAITLPAIGGIVKYQNNTLPIVQSGLNRFAIESLDGTNVCWGV